MPKREPEQQPDPVKPEGGEGDREADRRYREKTRRFVEEHEDATSGEGAVRGPEEAAEAERAEDDARARAKEKDPGVVRDYDEPTR